MKWTPALIVASTLAPIGAVPAVHTKVPGNLPLRFEENQGRDPKRAAKYIARGPGFLLSLAPAESWLVWGATHIHTRLIGANRNASMEPEQRLPGMANYFLGNPAQWRKDVVGYARMKHRNVYDGIDLVFHGEQGRLEYDFVLAPRADPARIRLELTGQDGLQVDDNGDLVISTSLGEIRWKRPESYQDIGGKRVPVAGRFVLSDGRTVRFAFGAYDTARTLIIDPTLSYSTYLGGSGNDFARGVGVDGSGNVYVAGGTTSPNLPVLSPFQASYRGGGSDFLGGDAFVAKFNPSGTLVYITYLGGAADDVAFALAVDSAGDAYITGFTVSYDFPITLGAYQPQFAGAGGLSFTVFGDAFIAKLSPSGNHLIYSTYLGGSQDDIGTAIAIDGSGNAFVTGTTVSRNFPTTSGAYQTVLHGGNQEPLEPCCGGPFINSGDAFVAKINPTGSTLAYSTLIGGSSDELAWTIALDSSGNVYIGGFTLSSNFPTTTGALQRTFGGVERQTPYFVTGDGFITKFNPTLSGVIYSTYFGGSGDEFITGIAVDSSGDLYFTGYSSTMNLPTTPGAPQPTYSGYVQLPFLIEYLSGDAIVGKLNPAGSSLLYLTYLGGNRNDAGAAIALDGAGNAYVTGFTDSTNFPVTQDAVQRLAGGRGGSDPYFPFGDAFLTVVNPTGTGLVYSTFFGGSQDDVALGLAVAGGQAYLVGNTYSTDLRTTPAATQTSFGGAQQGFPELWGDAFYAVLSGFPAPPAISLIANAEGESATIAPNTWVEIKGLNLGPANDMRIWQDSDFVNNQMPTQLDGVSATVNGKNAYIWYISPTQVNILTPPDPISGPVQVVVTNNGIQSAAFTAQAQSVSPSFFVVNGGPYVLGQHADYGLVGPTSLFPGHSTPAKPSETIILYANGFGATSVPVISGSRMQTGDLRPLPVIKIGGVPANVTYAALVAPGEYVFAVEVPPGMPDGDQTITATYAGVSTQPGTLITIHN
jgi:uncharacterized protein (TIGR03437 family)